MKNFTPKLKIYLIVFAFIISFNSFSQSTANYDISFTSTWSETTHPHPDFPSNAHWSDLVGATHNSSVTFVEIVGMEEFASPGIEDVAETGSNSAFNDEVDDAITAGTANQWLQQEFSPFAAISTATLSNITVSESFPLLSLISMIAPSPDWMIYVNSLNLRNATNDGWKNTFTIDLYPYDAGTEDNDNIYSTSNSATNPPEPITSLQGITPFSSLKVGTLTITLNSVLGVDEVSSVNNIKLYPNPVNDVLTIANIQNVELKTIEVYNLLGSLVLEVNINNLSFNDTFNLNVSDLNKGVYLTKLIAENNQSKTHKLLIE